MVPSRLQKKRLRAVLLVSAVGGVACGNFGVVGVSPPSSESGDGDEVMSVVEPGPDVIGFPPRDEWGSGGTPDNGEDPLGGAGGESLGWGGFVGIR